MDVRTAALRHRQHLLPDASFAFVLQSSLIVRNFKTDGKGIVPDNVAEVRQWIANWKIRTGKVHVTGVAHPPAHHQHHASPHAPTKTFADGECQSGRHTLRGQANRCNLCIPAPAHACAFPYAFPARAGLTL